MRRAKGTARLRPLPSIQVSNTTPTTPAFGAPANAPLSKYATQTSASVMRAKRSQRRKPPTTIAPRDLQLLQFEPSGGVHFGRVCAGSTLSRRVVLTNTLAQDLSLQVGCGRQEFSAEVTPASVQAGEQATIVVHAQNIALDTVCFVLFCFVLFCFVLFCFVLFCFVLSLRIVFFSIVVRRFLTAQPAPTVPLRSHVFPWPPWPPWPPCSPRPSRHPLFCS